MEFKSVCNKQAWTKFAFTNKGLELRLGTREKCNKLSSKKTNDERFWIQDWYMLSIPKDFASLCGLTISIERPSSLRKCTIGGPIIVGDLLYALTTRHSFDDVLEPGAAVPSGTADSTLVAEIPTRRVRAKTQYPRMIQDGQTTLYDPDYALLPLSDIPFGALEQCVPPRAVDGNIISKVSIISERLCGSVVINVQDDGLIYGELDPTRIRVTSGASVYSAQLIVLKGPGRPGISGAWVTKGEYVCGHIFAGEPDLPWIYMVPMSEIIEDLTQRTGETVRLPNATDVSSIRMDD